MPWIESLDWTSLNSLRRYPLRQGTSAQSVDGLFSLPDSLIVDFSLTATSVVTRRFYIARILNRLSSIILEVRDNFTDVVGTVEIQNATHTQDKDYYLTPTSAYIGATGRFTIGKLDDLAYQPAGSFEFSLSATEFEPRTIVPGLQGVDRIEFLDSRNGSFSLTGDVKIAARNNLTFVYSGVNDFNRVFIDVGDGLGLNKTCVTTTPVRSINGVEPDENGNISLLGTDCVKITSTEAGTLSLTDTCCTPCSGCNDLEELTTRLTGLESKFISLKGSYNDVNRQLNMYLSTVNASCACPV